MSGKALLWSGGCSVTHGRQLQFLWCLWEPARGGQEQGSQLQLWVQASPSAAHWEMGSGHRPDHENFNCKHPIQGQTHSCDLLQVPQGAKI